MYNYLSGMRFILFTKQINAHIMEKELVNSWLILLLSNLYFLF